MSTVLVRYFAGARAAAGVTEEKVSAATLGDLLANLGCQHGPALATTLTACSYLVDGAQWRDRSALLPDAATVDVLPPFAGG